MKWANFFHIYQPADQQPDILEAVAAQSYRPLLRGMREHPRVRIALNVTGALLELFDKYHYHDILDALRALGKESRIEFTGSAKYHAFLPLLEEREIVRQIRINEETLRFFLGDAFVKRGFFPPEMAYADLVGKIVAEEGYAWMLLDEIACSGTPGSVDSTKGYRVAGTDLKVFFRERRLSNLIMSAVVRSGETLKEAMRDDLESGRYVVTAMDGETFGHHRPGLEKMLFGIFGASEFSLCTISELAESLHEWTSITPVQSTWASSKEDIDRGIQFLSWSDPENSIHRAQWNLVHLALRECYALPEDHPRHDLVRKKMDKALASDHFWWASAKPWWSVEMIEDGAYRLLDVVKTIPDVSRETLEKGREYYEYIVSTAFQWQRTGKIRELMREQKSILRIPFKDRTLGRGGVERGVYYAFIDMMEGLEKEAARRGEYEKAILWRDAIYKLKHKYDIYDTINAIDLLRVEIPHEEVERTILEYKDRYREIRGGQPEDRG